MRKKHTHTRQASTESKCFGQSMSTDEYTSAKSHAVGLKLQRNVLNTQNSRLMS
uniref:Uncharacterized protein n=1 Tax=Octopus bimaculoides TaxID=37653 RepID=A0A0L8G932_OCTBM